MSPNLFQWQAFQTLEEGSWYDFKKQSILPAMLTSWIELKDQFFMKTSLSILTLKSRNIMCCWMRLLRAEKERICTDWISVCSVAQKVLALVETIDRGSKNDCLDWCSLELSQILTYGSFSCRDIGSESRTVSLQIKAW